MFFTMFEEKKDRVKQNAPIPYIWMGEVILLQTIMRNRKRLRNVGSVEDLQEELCRIAIGACKCAKVPNSFIPDEEYRSSLVEWLPTFISLHVDEIYRRTRSKQIDRSRSMTEEARTRLVDHDPEFKEYERKSREYTPYAIKVLSWILGR